MQLYFVNNKIMGMKIELLPLLHTENKYSGYG